MIVGVVFRGSLWLDGVVTLTLDQANRNSVSELATTIQSTRQYSQLHAIIASSKFVFSRKEWIADLARKVRIPVIAISKTHKASMLDRPIPGTRKFRLIVNGKHVLVSSAGTQGDQAEGLYSIGCRRSRGIPEAVRIADLLVRQLTENFLI
jgi:endonuclease V-like protein UPF0215 family